MSYKCCTNSRELTKYDDFVKIGDNNVVFWPQCKWSIAEYKCCTHERELTKYDDFIEIGDNNVVFLSQCKRSIVE